MGFFDGFPFTNTHQLNLDWILQRIGKVDADSRAAVEAANNATEAANNANSAVTAVNRRVDEAIENSLTAAEQAAASAATANNVATEIRGIANGATETANNAYNIASGIADTADQAFATAEEALSVVSGNTVYKEWSEVDTIYGNGTYAFNGINQTINGIYVTSAVMRVIAYNNSYCTQILRTVESASGHYKSYTLIRSRGVIGWEEWECPDPPFVVGVEYRTTERWKDKAVYAKLVYMGTLPTAGNVATLEHGAAATNMLRCTASTSEGATIPTWYTDEYYGEIGADKNSVFVTAGPSSDYATTTCDVKIFYTKD